ncbi:MAG: substrate-binding domain-containing protein [Chloroflexi bacterium]|nr:substrate-binding domain-containing protein [Chloroflexota bacterium]
MRGANLRLLLLCLFILTLIPIGSVNIRPVSARQSVSLEIVANDALAERVSRAVVNGYPSGGFTARRSSGAALADLCAGEFGVLATTTAPTAEEFTACPDTVELIVALDGAVVIISTQVDFLTCVESDQLKTLFGANGPRDAEVWNQLNPDYPERRVSVFATSDQDLKDYFYQRVVGEENGQRRGTEAFGDEPYRQINTKQGGIGFVPLAEYFSSPPTYAVVPLNNGTTCEPPTERTIADGDYSTATPVYWYIHQDPNMPAEALINLLTFAYSADGAAAIQATGAWPAPLDLNTLSLSNFQGGATGALLSGDSSPDFVVRLTWETSHDLDLGLYLPGGTEVNFANPAASGFYRVSDDGNDYCSSSVTPQEQIMALNGAALPTDYLAYVQLSLACGNEETTASFTVEFLIDGQVVDSVTGSIGQGENPFVVTFSYPG